MKTYEGKSVFGGVAIGKVLVYKKGEQQVKRYRVSDTKAEIERFEGAKAEAEWNEMFRAYAEKYPELAKEYAQWHSDEPAADLLNDEDFWKNEERL